MGKKDLYRTLPRTNKSKRRDERFWERWNRLGFADFSSLDGPRFGSPVYFLLMLRDMEQRSSWEQHLESLRSSLQKTRASLADIGTSEDELTQLVLAHRRLDAEKQLEHLRSLVVKLRDLKANNYWGWLLRELREAVDGGRLTPADIGTSEDELRQLTRAHLLLEAQKRLADLRSQNTEADCDTVFHWLRGVIDRNELSLAEIGTSEDELVQLLRAHYRRSAERSLDSLRQGMGQVSARFKVALFRLQAGRADLPLADLGTSEEELAQWERMAS